MVPYLLHLKIININTKAPRACTNNSSSFAKYAFDMSSEFPSRFVKEYYYNFFLLEEDYTFGDCSFQVVGVMVLIFFFFFVGAFRVKATLYECYDAWFTLSCAQLRTTRAFSAHKKIYEQYNRIEHDQFDQQLETTGSVYLRALV